MPSRRPLTPTDARTSTRDRGSVTAELAIAIPAVLALLLTGIGSVVIAARVVVVQDAASVLAREAARGDALRLPPALSARAHVDRVDRDGLACVTVTASAALGVIDLPVMAESCALA